MSFYHSQSHGKLYSDVLAHYVAQCDVCIPVFENTYFTFFSDLKTRLFTIFF